MNHLEKIKEILRNLFRADLPNLTPETRLIEDLGFDSLDLVELIMAFEDRFDIDIDDDEAEKCRTVADILVLLEKTLRLWNE